MRDEVPGYESEIEIARIRQISRQKEMTLAQIFGAIAEKLKVLPRIWHENGEATATAKKMVDAIIEAIELEGFFLNVSQRGYLLMSRADEETPLQPRELSKHFQNLIDAMDVRYKDYQDIPMTFDGEQLYKDYFLPRLRAY